MENKKVDLNINIKVRINKILILGNIVHLLFGLIDNKIVLLNENI